MEDANGRAIMEQLRQIEALIKQLDRKIDWVTLPTK
jgi:hypothetical protein